MFYIKLATRNITKNKPIYFPFLFSMFFVVMLNFLMRVILMNEGLAAMPRAQAVRSMFGFGAVVIMIFSLIFAFYTNGFLNKNRKKELGLYNVLGLDKKAIGWMLFIESILSYLVTVGTGLLFGSIFSKYLFLILKKLTGYGADFVFELSGGMFRETLLLMLGIFFALFVVNIISLIRTSPIDLLKGKNQGEKEPKANWINSVLGLICLGIGYYLALKTTSPLESLYIFFIAIIFVIAGTYATMVSFSVALLKLLKNRPFIYYRPKAFVNLSGMLYRMKQNGTGLASICILSTMVLVTVSSTVGLYVGQEDSLRNQHPFDLEITTQVPDSSIEPALEKIIEEHPVKTEDLYTFEENLTLPLLLRKGSQFTAVSSDFFRETPSDSSADLSGIEVLTLADYQQLTGDALTLEAQEVYLYSPSEKLDQEITIAEQTFQIKEKLSELPFANHEAMMLDGYTLIVKDQTVVHQLAASFDESANVMIGTRLDYNFSGTAKQREHFIQAAADFVSQLNQEAQNVPDQEEDYASLSSIDQRRNEISDFTGSFLFIGLIFSLTFTAATALIIYYKQISEGYEDAYRFEVMQKVGMSHKEVKQTIHSQVLMVFLFPILLAGIHLAFASPLIQKLLLMFGFHNPRLYYWITGISVAVFSLAYFLVYLQTSRVYYRIVELQA